MPPRILLVDDEEAILFAVSDYFRAHGYEMDCASDLAQAKARLAGCAYSAVIVDLRLNGTDGTEGLEVIAQARMQRPRPRMVLITAYGTPEIEQQAKRLDVDTVLQKPVVLAELKRIVASLLRNGPPEPT